jgi:phage gp29-like protein
MGALGGNHVQSWELFDMMEDTWPRLSKNLNELRNGVRNMALNFEPFVESSEDEPSASAIEKQKLVEAAFAGMSPEADNDENGLEATGADLLDCWAKGVTVLEVAWQIINSKTFGNIVAPKSTFWVHPVNYGWTTDGWLGLRNETNGTDNPSYYLSPSSTNVSRFPSDKFLVAIRKQKSGTALGGALLRPLCWWWLASNFSADWLLNLAQVHGLPFRWANYDANAPQATVDAICTMLQNMGSSGWAAFPVGTTLDLKEPVRNTDRLPQADVLDRADKNCDLIILGQTLTTDSGGTGKGSGSYALGKVHSAVRQEIIQACAKLIEDIYNYQLIPSIVRLNYGEDSECPSVHLATEDEEDLVQTSIILKNIAAFAYDAIPLSYINDTFNIPTPKDGEATLSPPNSPLGSPGGDGGKSTSETPTAPDGEPTDKPKADQPEPDSMEEVPAT